MSLQFVIDGYNITCHPEFTNNILKKITDSRSALVQLIHSRRLCGSQNNKAWIIFDGFPGLNQEDLSFANIEVVFSRKESADERIKKIIEKSDNPRNLVVVSDDKEIIFFAKCCKARTLSVDSFIQVKSGTHKDKQVLEKPGLNYTQMHKINEELKKLWLK